jgi:hypothetical protein
MMQFMKAQKSLGTRKALILVYLLQKCSEAGKDLSVCVVEKGAEVGKP